MNRNRTVLFECFQPDWYNKHQCLYSWIIQYRFEKSNSDFIAPFNVWMLKLLRDDGAIDLKCLYTDSGLFYAYEFIFESDEDKTLFCLKYL